MNRIPEAASTTKNATMGPQPAPFAPVTKAGKTAKPAKPAGEDDHHQKPAAKNAARSPVPKEFTRTIDTTWVERDFSSTHKC